MSEFTIVLVLAAFAGGAFGAALGALPAFAFTGFLVVAGEVLAMLDQAVGVDVTGSIAFGPVFGPHVSFGGGAAAAAYAAKRGYFDPEFEYHPAKYIKAGLGSKSDVLLVGGIFGVFGHLAMASSEAMSVPWDSVAFGVVASALVHRVAFGYSIVGRPVSGWLAMSPFERGEKRDQGRVAATDDGVPAASTGTRPAVEIWLPLLYRWSHVASLGVVVGILGAYIAYLTGSAFLAFGISAATLLYINAGVDRVPVTHHITLPASTVVFAAVPEASDGTVPALASSLGPTEALLLGAAAGLAGALLGELVQRLLCAHAETHFDPPAASIVLTTLGIAVLSFAGVLPHAAWIPVP